MIRVVARHIVDAEGTLIGDFPPSEIQGLIDLLDRYDIHLDDSDALEFSVPNWDGDNPHPIQFVDVKTGAGTSRLVMEVLFGSW